jgi:hypothetical protein
MSFDLKKLILNVLEEGFMEAPKTVMQPIIDYYFEKLKDFNRLGKQKVSKEFGTKTFELDFTGTRYEYLNEPNLKKIHVTLSNGYHSSASSTGNVLLDFSEPQRALSEVLEHEILHIIQMETGKSVSGNPKYQKKAKDKGFDKSEYHAGLPKKKHISRSQHPNPGLSGQRTLYKISKSDPTSYYGYKPATRNNRPYAYSKKRIDHSSRPIELYTDLLSTIRNLQLGFQKEISKLSISPEEKEKLKNSVPLRKKYYSVFIKDKNFNDLRIVEWMINREPITLKVSTPHVGDGIWYKFKKNLPENLYKDFLRLSYDAFVNREAPFDYEEIVKKVRELDDAKKEGEKEKAEKEQNRKEKGIVDLKFYTKFGNDSPYPTTPLAKNDYDRDYFLPNTDDIDKKFYDKFFKGARGEAAESILEYLFGANSREKKGDYWIILPTSRTKIIKGFQDLKKGRNEFYWFGEPDNEEDKNKIKLFYDKLKEKLKKIYVSALFNKEQSGYLENMIDGAYK